MFSLLFLWIGSLICLFRSRGNLVLENLVLRQQLAVHRSRAHPAVGIGTFSCTYTEVALNLQVFNSRQVEQGVLSSPSNVAFGIDTTTPSTPKFPVLNGFNINDPTAYTLTKTIGAVYSAWRPPRRWKQVESKLRSKTCGTLRCSDRLTTLASCNLKRRDPGHRGSRRCGSIIHHETYAIWGSGQRKAGCLTG